MELSSADSETSEAKFEQIAGLAEGAAEAEGQGIVRAAPPGTPAGALPFPVDLTGAPRSVCGVYQARG